MVQGRRGVGTTIQCVTGRLATLEQIIDWQPFDHVGWRLAVPSVGLVEAEADLVGTDDGSRLRLRWATTSGVDVPAAERDRIASEKRPALERLARALESEHPN